MRRVRALAVGVVIVSLVGLAGCDWTEFGFGPTRGNANPVEPGITPATVAHLTTAWNTPCNCPEPALVAGGLVYTADTQGTTAPVVALRARDASTGAERWASRFNDVGASFLGIGNGLAYARLTPVPSGQTGSDVVLALDATTGRLAWLSPVAGGGTIVQSLVDGNELFVDARSSTGDAITAFDSAGNILWSTFLTTIVTGMTADPGRVVYVVTLQPEHADGSGVTGFTGYAEPTGVVVNTHTADFGPFGLLPTAPLAFADRLLIGTERTRSTPATQAVAVSADTGAVAWSELGEAVGVASSNVVVTKSSGITARDPRTGALRWTVNLGATVDGAQNPVLAANVVFVVIGGMLQGFDVSNGAPSGTIAVSGHEITPSGGQVLVAGGTALDAVRPVGGT